MLSKICLKRLIGFENCFIQISNNETKQERVITIAVTIVGRKITLWGGIDKVQ